MLKYLILETVPCPHITASARIISAMPCLSLAVTGESKFHNQVLLHPYWRLRLIFLLPPCQET